MKPAHNRNQSRPGPKEKHTPKRQARGPHLLAQSCSRFGVLHSTMENIRLESKLAICMPFSFRCFCPRGSARLLLKVKPNLVHHTET